MPDRNAEIMRVDQRRLTRRHCRQSRTGLSGRPTDRRHDVAPAPPKVRLGPLVRLPSQVSTAVTA